MSGGLLGPCRFGPCDTLRGAQNPVTIDGPDSRYAWHGRSPGDRITSVVRQAPDGSCTGADVDLGNSLDFMDGAVIHYLEHASPISPSIQGRLRCTSSGAAVCPTQL